MSRARRLFWIAAVAAGLMLAEVVTALVLWVGIPRGPRAARWGSEPGPRELWGIDRASWVDLHAWTGLGLVVVIVVHVALHRRWIVCQARSLWTGGRRPSPGGPASAHHEPAGEGGGRGCASCGG